MAKITVEYLLQILNEEVDPEVWVELLNEKASEPESKEIKVKFIKAEPFRSCTLDGVLNEFRIIDSDIVFLIGRIFFTQNVSKKLYVGWGGERREEYCKSIEEFKTKHGIGEIEFVKRSAPTK